MREIVLDGKRVADDTDCYVIAEIGHNHQGDVETAKKMFAVAESCGANAVKLQTRNNHALFTRQGYNAPYENENSYGATYGEHREALEFSTLDYIELMEHAKSLGITMFSTPFDFYSADLLMGLGMPFFKVASGDLTNIPLLEHIAKFGKPMLISTGGATFFDVERAYNAVTPYTKDVVLMQCTASYPADFEVLNLKVISAYRETFPNAVVGLSSHDNGISMAPVAYTLGARVIEKHFTLNRALKGTDHAFSLEPQGLRKMVRDLRRVKVALGDGLKAAYGCELEPIRKMSKSLYAAHDIAVGSLISREDIALKSPGGHIPPYRIEEFVGRRATEDISADDPITPDNTDWIPV